MGTVRYESNPPKVGTDARDRDAAVQKSLGRLQAIAPKCDAIHITENVLGFERVSPITMGELLKERVPDMPVTVSLRVRDKTELEIHRFVARCIESKFDGILVLMGDPSRDARPDTGQVPSAVVERLRLQGVDSEIDLYMSVSNDTPPRQIQKKVRAGPAGFFTQVVQDADQIREIAGRLEGFRIIPVILHPSPKNQRSAEFLGLDLGSYERGFDEFVREAYGITGDILITSPSDFAAADSFLAGFGSGGSNVPA